MMSRNVVRIANSPAINFAAIPFSNRLTCSANEAEITPLPTQ